MSRAQGKSHSLRLQAYSLQKQHGHRVATDGEGVYNLTRKQARRVRKKDNQRSFRTEHRLVDEINGFDQSEPNRESAQTGSLGTAIGMALWNLSGGRVLRATRHPGTKNRTPKRKRK